MNKERHLNVYGIGRSDSHQSGFNHLYYEHKGDKDDYLERSKQSDSVKKFAQVVQYGTMGEHFESEEEILAPQEYVVHVSCGQYHTLFVTNCRRVFCCGRYCDNYGNLSSLKQVTLLPKLSNCNIVETKCGNSHSFFISEGYECVYASGHNTHGECGVTKEKKHDLTKLEGIEGKQLKMVTPGAYHTVFVTVDNCVYTCGYCAFGSLGQGYQSQQSLVPVRVDHPDLGFGSKKIRSVECGYWHSIVVTDDGSAYSWGYNRHGECGLNSVSRDGIQSPTLVTGIPDHEKLVDARCGSRFTVFRTRSNNFYGCGDNSQGALGLLFVGNQSVVSQIPLSIGTVLDYTCGKDFTLFTTKEGFFLCGDRKSKTFMSSNYRDSRLVSEVCLPWIHNPFLSDLHCACSNTSHHALLYNVPKVLSTFLTKLFTTQQNEQLCDLVVVVNN